MYLPSASPKCLWPKQAELSEELLHLQEKLTVALEHLLAMRATLSLHQWELDLQVEPTRHLSNAQFDDAVREAVACHSTTATALKKTYNSNIMALDWEAKMEEGRECQAFAEAFWTVVQTCLPEA